MYCKNLFDQCDDNKNMIGSEMFPSRIRLYWKENEELALKNEWDKGYLMTD